MKISLRGDLKRFGPWTGYHWGWETKLPGGWWFVWSRSGHPLWVYISNDATPPKNRNRGFFIWRSRRS